MVNLFIHSEEGFRDGEWIKVSSIIKNKRIPWGGGWVQSRRGQWGEKRGHL